LAKISTLLALAEVLDFQYHKLVHLVNKYNVCPNSTASLIYQHCLDARRFNSYHND